MAELAEAAEFLDVDPRTALEACPGARRTGARRARRQRGMKRPATQWVKPGIIGRVKHLRGEEYLHHASLQDFREMKMRRA
ncbi:hypothetical protein [Mesorhizobium sp. NZP2077]|uniref:hypothetical protein n=1 Tax=Mesorhizobium sp. NZP2077 TaxID=2483404 RepID=UPI001FED972F|nr:hypothetical protein [Mesorhizobium sp. NZP2077]